MKLRVRLIDVAMERNPNLVKKDTMYYDCPATHISEMPRKAQECFKFPQRNGSMNDCAMCWNRRYRKSWVKGS